MTFTVTSDSFKEGDYLPNDFILSADFGFGCAGGKELRARIADKFFDAEGKHE